MFINKTLWISSVQDLIGSDPEKLVNILDASYTEVIEIEVDIYIYRETQLPFLGTPCKL